MTPDFGALLATYSEIFGNYDGRTVSTERDLTDKENRGTGGQEDAHYLDVGREALCLIVSELLANDRPPPTSILDFPSGSGRVTRHLRAAFPEARIGACDLYDAHVQFCVDAFGAEAVPSAEDLDEAEIGPEWDLVFCGSLLTHLPEPDARAAIRFMTRALSPTGIALFTVEGRRSIEIQSDFYKLTEDKLFERILKDRRKTGFGFADYNQATKRLFDKQARYGVAVVKPSWIVGVLEESDVRLLGYTERAWDNHQDLVVFGRPGPTGLGH